MEHSYVPQTPHSAAHRPKVVALFAGSVHHSTGTPGSAPQDGSLFVHTSVQNNNDESYNNCLQ